MIIPVELGRRSNRSRHGHEGDARLVNCYAESLGAEGKAPYAVYAHDGWTDFSTLTDNGVRAMLELDGYIYVVADRSIIRVDQAGNATSIGGIIGDGLVTMARNRAATAQIGVCADGIFKIITGTTVQSVTDTDLPPANSVCHLDGYFILTIPDGRYFITSINDGFSIDGLDFAKAEANPDGLLRGVVRGRDVCLFGPKSIEFIANTGGADFPFSRTTSIDIGLLSPGAVAEVDQTLAFVAHDGTVRVLNGYQAQPISTPDIDRLIDDEPDKSDITAMSWFARGHTFFAVSGSNWTQVWDARENLWHERESYGVGRWRAATAVQLDGAWIFGDYTQPKLYRQAPDSYSESGQPIVMTIQTPTVHAYPYRLEHNRLYVDAIPGVGLNEQTSNDDPQIMLSYSEDGGATWSDERFVGIGRQGHTKARIVARRLGTADEDGRIYRIRVSADVIKGIMAAAVDAERLAA